MSYQILASPRYPYILVWVTAFLTRELALKITTEAAALGNRRGLTTYLYDLRRTPDVKFVKGCDEFMLADLKDAPMQQARIALLTKPSDSLCDFMAPDTADKDVVVRSFHNQAKAVAWLKK